MHHEMQSRNLDKNPDEVTKVPNSKIEVAKLGDTAIGRLNHEYRVLYWKKKSSMLVLISATAAIAIPTMINKR